MAELKTYLIGTLVVVTLVTAFYGVINSYYAANGVSTTLDSTSFNSSGAYSYMGNWANQTSAAVANAQAVPVLSTGLVLLTGVFQSITLMVGLPANVILPMFYAVGEALHLPGWFVAFAFIIITVLTMFALVNVLRGRDI